MRIIAEKIGNLSFKARLILILASSLGLMTVAFVILLLIYVSEPVFKAPMRLTDYEEENIIIEEYPGPYDPENFENREEFKYYFDNGDLKSMMGIDVSYAQREIDWKKVKAAGIDFAIIRVGYRGYESGDIHKDEYFDRNIEGAVNAGIKVGVYFFSQALSADEAQKEAEFTLEQIKGLPITFPVVFDWETIGTSPARTDDISSDDLNKSALKFCEIIENAGYKPMVYSSLNLLREQFNKYDNRITRYDLWLAEYKDHPEYPKDFKMWQYTSEGHVDGIQKLVDLDVFFGTAESAG